MKIILTAFNQTLISKVMDYPENTPHEIMLIMDFDLIPIFDLPDYKPSSNTIKKAGRFVSTGTPIFLGNIRVMEYKLVEVR